eukprot:scaffold28477_cov112-Isochrysis_galbana.AAC.6
MPGLRLPTLGKTGVSEQAIGGVFARWLPKSPKELTAARGRCACVRVSEVVREGVRTSRGVERRLDEGGAGRSRLVGGMQLGPYSCDGFHHAAGLLRLRLLYFGGWDRDWAVSCRVPVVAAHCVPVPVPCRGRGTPRPAHCHCAKAVKENVR